MDRSQPAVRYTQLSRHGRRQIGSVGTAFRVVLGVVLLFFGVQGSRFMLIHGHFRFAFDGFSAGTTKWAAPSLRRLTTSNSAGRTRKTAVLMQTAAVYRNMRGGVVWQP